MRRFNVDNFCYHTISVTDKRRKVFADPENAELVIRALNFAREDMAFLLAYCLLPNHMHLVFVPKTGHDISQVMRAIKGFSSREINKHSGRSGRVWQPSFYDRVVRNDQQLETLIAYVHANPVEEELVANPEEYLYSSAHPGAETDLEAWYQDERADEVGSL